MRTNFIHMNIMKYFISLFVTIFISSCINQEKYIYTDPEEFLSFDVTTLDNKEYEIKLTDLVESIEIIQMDSVQEAFTEISKVAVSKNYFAIHHSGYPVKLYSRKSGKFLGNIGRAGNGPGEYFLIWNVEIDEEHNRIYLVNQGRKQIYSYDLNGNFHSDETIPFAEGELERPWAFFNKKKNQIVIFQTPYKTYQKRNISLPAINVFCLVQDFSGKTIQKIPSMQYQVPRNDSHSWASHIDPQSPIYQCSIVPFYDCRKDTIYHYNVETNELYPVYTSNMFAEKLTLVMSKETPLHYYTYQQTYRKGTMINPEYRTGYKLFQVDKKNRKGKYIRVVNDYLGGIEFDVDYWFHDIRDDYVVYYWEPLVLLVHLEEALVNNDEMSAEVRERVMKLKNSLDENDNNVMMICKFKK